MPFCGMRRATATTSGSRGARAAGAEAVVDAVGGDGDVVGVDAVVLDDLVAGRGRRGEQRAAAGRRGARGGARWRGRRGAAAPGRSMSHVPRCTWWTTPTWGSRDQSGAKKGTPWKISMMPSAGPSRPRRSSSDGGGEHAQPAAAAHHADAVARRPRAGAPFTRPVWRTTSRPAADEVAGHLAGVLLGAARVGVVEVAEGEDVDPAEPRPRRPARPSRRGRGWSRGRSRRMGDERRASLRARGRLSSLPRPCPRSCLRKDRSSPPPRPGRW